MSYRPNRFLHADAAGAPAVPPLTSRPMLPIRQNLNRLTALNRTQRAVLIEVAELAENGSHKAFTTDNAYLIERIGGTMRTISRALGLLKELDLLQMSGATKLRRITTTSRLRVCYTGTEPEQFAAVEALNVALENAEESHLSIDKNGLSIDNGGDVYRQTGYVSIDNGGSVYSHSVSPYKETTKNDYKDEQKEEVEALRSALAAAEKKNTQLAEQLEHVTQQRDMLRNSLAAVRPGGATASASHTGGAAAATPHKLPFSQSRHATPEGFAELARRLNYGAAYAPHYLAHIGVKAEGEADRDERGWQNFVQRYLSIDANSKTGLITTPPHDSAHASANHFPATPGGAGRRQPHASRRLDVEAAVAVAGAFASLSAPAESNGPAERHDGCTS